MSDSKPISPISPKIPTLAKKPEATTLTGDTPPRPAASTPVKPITVPPPPPPPAPCLFVKSSQTVKQEEDTPEEDQSFNINDKVIIKDSGCVGTIIFGPDTKGRYEINDGTESSAEEEKKPRRYTAKELTHIKQEPQKELSKKEIARIKEQEDADMLLALQLEAELNEQHPAKQPTEQPIDTDFLYAQRLQHEENLETERKTLIQGIQELRQPPRQNLPQGALFSQLPPGRLAELETHAALMRQNQRRHHLQIDESLLPAPPTGHSLFFPEQNTQEPSKSSILSQIESLEEISEGEEIPGIINSAAMVTQFSTGRPSAPVLRPANLFQNIQTLIEQLNLPDDEVNNNLEMILQKIDYTTAKNFVETLKTFELQKAIGTINTIKELGSDNFKVIIDGFLKGEIEF
ncbi:MAG: hypothetical protein WC860_09695 [Candidatus Margulisiibacteriota bacterium]|jgi:hypothetical protein